MVKILKPITEYSPQELLDLISENPQTNTFESQNDFIEFISIYGIKEGTNRVMIVPIYNTYKKFSQNPISKRAFANEMVQYFPYLDHLNVNIYLINRPRVFFLEKNLKKYQNKTKRKPWLRHFKKFVVKFELKSGSFYVKDIVLYNLYDKWVYKNNNRNPLSFKQFLKFCKLFFKNPAYKLIKGNLHFSVDKCMQKFLTPELIQLMRTNEKTK